MSKVKQVRKVDIKKDERAIRHNRISKKTGAIIACICIFVLIAGTVGLGFGAYAIAENIWDKNIGEESGVAFNELFGILNGVTKTNEDKIVSNKYSQEDLDGFYDNLKNKLFLADDYDLNLTELLKSLLGNNKEEQPSQVNVSTKGTDGYDLVYIYQYPDGSTVESQVALAGEITEGEQGGQISQGTGNPALDALLQELEFDFSSLENYQGEKNILEISDKQLAAVIDEVYGSLDEIFTQVKDLETKLGKPLDELLEVKQVIISGDIADAKSVKLKITAGVNVRDALSKMIDEKGLPSILKKLLPKHLYATVIAYPYDNSKSVQASINQLSEVNVDKIVSIVDVILKKAGVDFNIHKVLVDVNTKVVDLLNKAQEKLPLTFVNTGSVDLYPIETLMKTLKVDISEQAFLYMMRDIKLPTEHSLGYDIYTPEQKLQDTDKFVGELTEKYCIDNSQGIVSVDNTITDIVNLAGSEDFLQKIQIKNMHYTESYSQNYYRAQSSYLALANMLTTYAGNENLLGNIKAEIITMSYDEDKALLSVDIKVKVAEMLGFDDNSTMANLIKQLIPEAIFAKAVICLDENYNIATSVEINKVGQEKSKEHLATLTALGNTFGMNVENLDYDKICQQIDEGIRNGFEKIREAIKCDIIFTDEGVYLPSVFELVSANEKVNGNLAEGEHIITDAEIWQVMKGLYDYEYVDDGSFVPVDNINGFIEELYTKFFISDSFKQQLVDSQADNTFLDALKKGVGQNFSTDNVRLKEQTDILPDGTTRIVDGIMSKNNITPVYNEEYITQKFKPVFLVEEIAYLINTQSKIFDSISFLKDLKVIFASNNTDEMTMIVEGKGNIEDQNINSLLPEKINVDIVLNLGQINDDGTRDDLLVSDMGVNNVDDRTQSSQSQMSDLDLLFLFINRVSRDNENIQEEITVENTKEKIEKGINEDTYEEDGTTVKSVCLKNQIHNDVYTVSFLPDGGFRVNQTIYEIIINELYKPEEGEPPVDESQMPSENDFRNAICKVNNMPDKTTYTSSTRQDYIIDLTTGNKAENANNAIDDINAKYFLNDSAKLNYEDVTNNANILDSISSKAENYSTSINGKAMAESTATLQQLKPIIDGTEMLLMLENSLVITAKGYENAKMSALYVTRNSSTMVAEKGEIVIVFNSPVDKSIVDVKYQELMPEKLALLVVVDMNKLALEVCTNIYVNDLTAGEMQAINALLVKISADNNQGETSGDMDLNKLNLDCSESVKNTMNALTNNMDLTLIAGTTEEVEGVQSSTAGKFVLEGAFEVAAKNLSTPEKEITPENLRDVLKALFADFETNAYTGGATTLTDTQDESQKNNYNIFISGNIALMQATVEGAIGEGNLLAKVDLNKLGEDFGVTNAEQTAFVPAIANDPGDMFGQLRQEFRLDQSKEYYLITFRISSKGIIGNTTDNQGEVTILPEYIYTTLCVDLTSGANDISIVYNKLNEQQTDILSSIISKNQGEGAEGCLSDEKINKMRNDLLGTVLLKYTYTGYGSMQLTLEDVLNSGHVVIKPNDGTNTAVNGIGMMTFDITKELSNI